VESNAQLLEKTLIGRKEVVDLLEKLVIESANSGNKHQRLIIGPRGSGKTHLLRVLYNRLSNRKELQDKLKIAYLCEDEYGVASFLDFIIRIFRAFIKWDEKNSQYLVNEIDQLKKTSVHNQEKIAVKILLEHIKGKTLFIIVENIGNIFAGIGKEGQAKLRDLVNQHPYFTIMASNQALFADVQFEDRPFHNFFAIIHLKKLTVEEAVLFLQTIAQWEGKTDLLEFLEKPEGIGRIRAIYDITGGNHRLLVTFYNFLKVEYKNKLSHSFIKTINDLIPYYQSFMNLLSAQQQKIVQYLCQNRKPANVKEIAENCFTTHNTISKQMLNLVKLKYVDATPSGKETYYELSEPLLRICYEVKENRGGPVKLFIDFLGNLYSFQEIKKKYMQFHLFAELIKGKKTADFSQEQLYYKEALKQYFPMELEKYKLMDFENTGTDFKIKTYIRELEESKDYSSILQFTAALPLKDSYLKVKEAAAHQAMGDIEKAIEKAEALLKENENDIDALLLYADALKEKGEWSKSAEYYQKILKIEPNNSSVLTMLGEAQFYLGEINDAVINLFKAVQLNKADNLLKVAVTLIISEKEKVEKAKSALEKILTVNSDDPAILETIAGIYQISDYFDEAIPIYEKLIQLKPENALFHFQLVACFIGLNNIPPALSHLEKALKLFDTGEEFYDLYLQVFWVRNLTTIFIQGTMDNISRYLYKSLFLVEKFNYKNEFLESIIDVIFGLLKEHESLELSWLEGLETLLTEIFQDEKDMMVPLKFLNIGIRHLKKKEKNVLLQFTKEERKIFKRFVLDKLNPVESL
jgi:tetratricopeptide (TPR) repeat protein